MINFLLVSIKEMDGLGKKKSKRKKLKKKKVKKVIKKVIDAKIDQMRKLKEMEEIINKIKEKKTLQTGPLAVGSRVVGGPGVLGYSTSK